MLGHLQSQVVVEQAEVTHIECGLHLLLELADVGLVAACDHQIIHVHADDEAVVTNSAQVDCVLGGAPLKPQPHQQCVKLGVPGAEGSTQTVERLHQMQDLVFMSTQYEPWCLLNVDRSRTWT